MTIVPTVPDLVAAVGAAPASGEAHLHLADAFARAGKLISAIAEYRTALTLGGENAEIRVRIAKCAAAVAARQPADTISHNLYSRTQWLARHIRSLFPSGKFSILDAGGGDGRLAMDLPDADYVLAEPATNGVFVTEDLSFGRKFDCVVCCHVLEHIPIAARDTFLDGLCAMANDCLLLLNPVVDPRIDQRAWQQVIYEVTGAKWAKEHIDCIMPRLEDITGYAERRGHRHRVRPNGSKATALAVVFFDHFSRFGRPDQVARINRMFNAIALDDLDSAEWPNAYLVEIQTKK
jgi:hypothetical protein